MQWKMFKVAMCFQLLFLCFSVAQAEILDHRFFLEQLIQKYGFNGSISFEGFQCLYGNLGLGNSSCQTKESAVTPPIEVNTPTRSKRNLDNSDTTVECEAQKELSELVKQHVEFQNSPGRPRKPPCLVAQELLAIYGLSHTRSLSPVSFLHLCPAVLYQLDVPACQRRVETHSHSQATGTSNYLNWVLAFVAVGIISISGLLLVFLVPLLTNNFVSQLVSFLVALAAGTLLGDAFLHLIPHALVSADHNDAIVLCGLLFITLVFFFSLEAVLNIIRTNKEKHKVQDKVNYTSVSDKEMVKEMVEMGDDHKHSYSPVHSHSHGSTPQSNTALMVVLGDGLHNLTDGLAIGAAFSGGVAPGLATAFAVFTHELPHELGDIAVLLQAGLSVRRAAVYNMVASAISVLGTFVGLLIGNLGKSTQWVYALTAGSFIYIALSNLVPEMNRQKAGWEDVVLRLSGILCGGALMACIAVFEHDIQHWFL